MQKTFIHKAATLAAVFASLAGLASCVNEQYEISEERLDLNVTAFQEGLCLPLGSTEKIRLDSVIRKLGLKEDFDKIFSTENGAYSFYYKPEEPLDLTEQLESINGVLDLDAIDFSKTIDFSLSEVDLGSVSYNGDSYDMGQDLDEMFADFDVTVPPIQDVNFEIPSGISQYAHDFENIEFELKADDLGGAVGEGEVKVATVPATLVIPDNLGIPTDEPKDLDWWEGKLGRKLFDTEEHLCPVPIAFEYKFPKEVKSVKELHVAANAKLKVTAEIINPFFESGAMVPHIEVDLKKLFDLAERADGTVHDNIIDEDFSLAYDSQWKDSDEITITGLVLNDDDFTNDPEDGRLVFRKDLDLELHARMMPSSDVSVSIDGLKNWLENHQEDRGIYVKVAVTFDGLKVDDATIELVPVEVARTETFNIEIPSFKFPQEVKTVEQVLFTDSQIDVNLSASGLAELGELDFDIESMTVTFPDELDVEGGNVVALAGGSLAEGISKQIILNGIDIADPDEDGNVPSYVGVVSVDVVGKVHGDIQTGKLPAIAESDVKLLGNVATSVEIADYTITVDGYKLDSEVDTEAFDKREMEIEVPKEMADIKGLKVFFENDPAITINIDIPDVTPDVRPTDERGLVVKFPEALKFKDFSDIKWYDEQKHALVFSKDEDFPEQIVLPIDYLTVNPQKDQESGKYYVKGAVEVTGSVGIADGSRMTKADVEKLAQPGARVSFSVVIPELKPSGASMESYVASIEEEVEFEPLKDVELPELLSSVGQIVLDDVYLYLSVVTGTDFPNLGDDAALSFGADVTLPEFLTIDDERYSDGRLSVSGILEKGTQPGSPMQLVIAPIRLKSLDLNKTNEELTGLKGSLSINGNVSLTGASVVLDEWLDKTHSFDVRAGLATFENGAATDKIGIEKVTGKVDYQLDPVSTKLDLTSVGEFLSGDNINAVVDISRFFVTADLTTNLGVPVKADMKIVPYYGPEAGAPVEHELVIDGASSAAEPKTTKIYLSNREPEDAQAYDKFINLDIVSLLYKDEAKTQVLDSIKVELNAGTDADKMCIYEPSAEYTLTVDYAAGLPVAFGEDFMIEYRDTLALPDEVAMIMEYGSLALCGEIESSLPIGFNLTARLLDSNNQELKVSDKNIGMQIKSSDAAGNPVKSKLELVLGNENKIDLSDLKSLELVFSADSKMAPNVQFREDNFIRASLYALIPEGLTLDAAEVIKSGDDDDEGENTDNE